MVNCTECFAGAGMKMALNGRSSMTFSAANIDSVHASGLGVTRSSGSPAGIFRRWEMSVFKHGWHCLGCGQSRHGVNTDHPGRRVPGVVAGDGAAKLIFELDEIQEQLAGAFGNATIDRRVLVVERFREVFRSAGWISLSLFGFCHPCSAAAISDCLIRRAYKLFSKSILFLWCSRCFKVHGQPEAHSQS
jgi:hypothetical protein